MAKWITTLMFLSCWNLQAFQQDTLQVAIYNSPPFGILNQDGSIGGLMVELWQDIAEENNWNCQYVFTDLKTVLNGLQQGKFDVGLGAISITPMREELVDFSQAVNPSGTGIASSKDAVDASFFKRWGPILISLLELIGVLLLMLLISAFIVWIVERRNAKRNPNEKSIVSLADGLWWSAVTMTTVGYGDKVPHSRIGKILGVVWIFTSIIFFSLFTANASAKLSQPDKQIGINTLDDLRAVEVLAVKGSSGEEFLMRENVEYKPCKNIEEAIRRLLNNEAVAIVSNVPVLKYHNKTNFQNRMLISDSWLMRNNMGIAVQEQSPLLENIDRVLLQKITEPKWQQALYKYIGD